MYNKNWLRQWLQPEGIEDTDIDLPKRIAWQLGPKLTVFSLEIEFYEA